MIANYPSGERLLTALECLDRSDPSYPIQRSILAGYVSLGRLVCERPEQSKVEESLDNLEAAVRSGDASEKAAARQKLKVYAFQGELVRLSVLSAALGLRDAAARMVEVAAQARADEDLPPAPPDPAG